MNVTIPMNGPTIAMTVLGSIVAVNLLLWALFILYAKFGALRPHLRTIITLIDEFCDSYTDPEKRKKAIENVNGLLGWRRIFIPEFLVGWAVDSEVYFLHKVCPDVHKIQQVTAEGVQVIQQVTADGVQAIQDSKEAKP